ncbi:sigma-E processing peptidase SpoIIGA [Chakrabartyella piscis]|uniref:sigma-E processing peptidase SpoIIGA n=1 Tax=Chakrabartyella piscis TaxID=2918914 RepID=UPI0029587F59|nr:sigma-E processing peptidase SpoIIGA [Chakrabartyella piscis]
MGAVVYIDVLFLVEWMMDGTILFLTGKIVRYPFGIWRYILGGMILSLCHMMHVLYMGGFNNSIVLWLVMLLVIWWIFHPKSLKRWMHLLLAFCLSSFVLCGCVQVFLTFYQRPLAFATGWLVSANWTPWYFLVWSVCISYMGVRVAGNWLQSHITHRKQYANVMLQKNGKETQFLALIDTGNTLQKDGHGVLIVELPRLLCLLEEQQIQFLLGRKEKQEFEPSLLQKEMRGIEPLFYDSLGNTSGVLYGFYVEHCKIITDTNKWEFTNLYIGIGEDGFSGGYEGLIPSCLLEEVAV